MWADNAFVKWDSENSCWHFMAENGIIEWHRDSVWNHAYVFLYIAYQQNTSVNTGKQVLISSSLALVC